MELVGASGAPLAPTALHRKQEKERRTEMAQTQTVTLERRRTGGAYTAPYKVVKTQNTLSPIVGMLLTTDQVQALIDGGVTVNIKQAS